ncbi:MAG TPA: lysophospholipid acyltransferase family protein [Steroidobacteraceae bacterium]|nr:lysophospholipid acyltransferase family protein [Steroidobacteraceae bacterium]
MQTRAKADSDPTPLPLWLKALARLPWPVLYGATATLACIGHRLVRYRLHTVRANIAGCFPQLAAAEQRRIERGYYRRLGELVAEILKSAVLTREELARRVALRDIEIVRSELDAGRSVIIVAAHQCNWEWLLLALSIGLGHPLEAAYKPLHGSRSERTMRALRTRFGGTLTPAKDLLARIVTRRDVRVLAMVADQEPVTSDFKWWTQFLGRSTAFYMGPEKIAQATRLAVIFAAMRRIERGRYEVAFSLIAAARAGLEPGALTERYARLVEAQVRASPEDWTWSHRRWKLRKPVYSAAADS